MSAKDVLRQIIREKIRRLAPGELEEKSMRLCRAVETLPEWRNSRVICLFAPLPGEPGIDRLETGTRRVCYPRVEGNNLALHFVTNPRAMELSRWNIREPQADSGTLVEPGAIDLILIPGLAFSPGGGRLGRGAGFYDRLLARPGWRAFKIGICFDCQLAADLPVEAHDHAVDCVVTELGRV